MEQRLLLKLSGESLIFLGQGWEQKRAPRAERSLSNADDNGKVELTDRARPLEMNLDLREPESLNLRRPKAIISSCPIDSWS
jgi:hypothetical protein